jgi:hypothetical protein|tara:strand:+ start:122 stop:688 length:567 start_codon:yes stop_codon:yes gene_type:complete
MKKISFLIIAVTTIASAQLRVGVDVSRKMKVTPSFPAEMKALALVEGINLPGTETMTAEGLGFTVGYDFMLASLVGVGAELNIASESDDEDGGPSNQIFAYSIVKLPFGVPFARGVVRIGIAKSFEEGIDPGLGYGFGLRIKPPLFPIGAEASYNIYNYSQEEKDAELGTMKFDLKQSYMNLSLTYSF